MYPHVRNVRKRSTKREEMPLFSSYTPTFPRSPAPFPYPAICFTTSGFTMTFIRSRALSM
jgi:hypothetical protein